MKTIFFQARRVAIVLLISIAIGLPGFALATNTNKKLICNLYVTKTKGWQRYDVKIAMVDFDNEKPIFTLDLSAPSKDNKNGIMELQKRFDCSQYKRVYFQASFTPEIWQGQENKEYKSKLIYTIQHQMLVQPEGVSVLQFNLTFPDDFNNVPELVQ